MTTLTSAPRRGGGPLPYAALRGAESPLTITRRLPRPRSRVVGRLLRGVSLLLSVTALLALAGVGSLQVLQSSRTATVGYELRTLQSHRTELGARVRLLEAEIAQMADLDVVYMTATERLGMVRPEQSLRITVVVPTPAVIPMPERYAEQVAPLPTKNISWWKSLLGSVPGLD